MEKYTMFMDWKNQYSENEYTSQSNLRIQCNPHQLPMVFFMELEQQQQQQNHNLYGNKQTNKKT